MSKKPQILITDDEKSIRNILRDILEYESYDVHEAESGSDALEIVSNQPIDLVILDIKMKGMDGIETLDKIKELEPELPVIMISGHGTIKIAVDAAKKGAYDFLEKPPDLNRLLITVRNALKNSELIRENKQIRSELHGASQIIGESPSIKKIKKTISKIAATSSRVLITGENGTGKELVARSIHSQSRRASGSFVDVNCAAIPSELLESELFGHEKGAFTGASKRRIGKFEQADGGTLFLDEIGDLSSDAQAKVLRALQENSITRVGGNENIPVDVRVISATNKDLQQALADGEFREDLFHRLSVIPIHIPPLRDRKEDIPILANSFLSRLGEEEIVFSGKSFTDDAIETLKELRWSGNIRELQNVIERLAILSEKDEISADDVERLVVGNRSSRKMISDLINDLETFQDFKEEAEKLFLLKKLEKYNWNISATADAIDIRRSHIYTKMKKYDIER